MERLTVAIDGPAGAGKSSAARLVAKRLGYLYIDTGAMYRAFTWAMLQEKIDIGDAEAVRALTERIDWKISAACSSAKGKLPTPSARRIYLLAYLPFQLLQSYGKNWYNYRGTWPKEAASFWTAATSAPSCCRRPI